MSSVGVDLYWIPLGAGQRVVRASGKLFEALSALIQRRRRCDLYHSALAVTIPEGRFVIEMTPIPDLHGERRGVVAEGPVGAKWAGSAFEHSGTRSADGETAPSPTSTRPRRPSPSTSISPARNDSSTWCRRCRHPCGDATSSDAGEMWNSNSVVSWLLASSGIDVAQIQPPPGGRAPGWTAGVVVAARDQGAR